MKTGGFPSKSNNIKIEPLKIIYMYTPIYITFLNVVVNTANLKYICIWLIWNSIKISFRGNENNDLVNGERFIIKCWNGNCEVFFAAHVAADDDDDGGWIPSFTSEYLV